MTELFKCLALLCTASVVYSFTDVRDDASWLKNGSRIKDLFSAGVVNGIVDTECNDVSDQGNVQGVCMSKAECAQLGGKPGALCSLVGSCCYIKKTCKQTTSAKVSYFVPPNEYTSPCELTVRKYSRTVCQIRLDFEKFTTAPPTNVDSKAHICQDDIFKVTKTSRKLNIPHLCGKNAGQHMYIPIDDQQTEIGLRFRLKKRGTGNIPEPDWKIKITQLECLQPDNEHFLRAPSKLMTIHNNLKNKKQSQCCYDLIAPPGCLQFYTKSQGTFESFNYDYGNGKYIGGFDYAVCLRQSPQICGAKYELNLQMNKNENECHPTEEASSSVSQDYIRIPEGFEESEKGQKIFKDHYCGKKTVIIKAISYEPLYVGVHTDMFIPNTGDEKGFQIKYELIESSDICSSL